jgi:SAM-dependent methyltransferase
MKRKFLYKLFKTPKGQVLQAQEAAFLQRAINVSYKQIVMQIGSLGWENEFIDCSLYQYFVIVDAKGSGGVECSKIKGLVELLPILTDSVDMIILPHVLEFVADQHHVLREVARIIKPEGKLIILNFNPWRAYVHFQYLCARERHDPLRGLFLTQSKIIDWLKLLNFDVEVAAGFNFDSSLAESNCVEKKRLPRLPVAYAVKAIKRRYNIIPLTPVKVMRPKLAVVSGLESTNGFKKS